MEYQIYEEIELERKDLVNEADDLEKIQLSKKYNNLVLETVPKNYVLMA